MRVQLKPLDQQVVLITGATSGIGRQSAVRFAKAGAKVVCVARNADALADVVGEITAAGGTAASAVADVADESALRSAADFALHEYGRIDTWVNNAGVGMYTRLLDTPIEDDRRLFETNFWGLVHGSRIAVPLLIKSGGGALINLGSEVSDVSIPVQGMYATSKHAIMGFTDALRDEILHDELPVSVTLIKPAAINTPFANHALNRLNKGATLPSPVYAVDLVADQILHAAQYGGRELYAGGGAWLLGGFIGPLFAQVTDVFMSTLGWKQQLADRPADNTNAGLHSSRGFHRAEGEVDRDRHVQQVSVYGLARRNPLTTAALAAATLAVVSLVIGKSVDHD